MVKIEFDISQGDFDSMRKAFHVFMPNKDSALTATDWLRASVLFYQGVDRWLGPRYQSYQLSCECGGSYWPVPDERDFPTDTLRCERCAKMLSTSEVPFVVVPRWVHGNREEDLAGYEGAR